MPDPQPAEIIRVVQQFRTALANNDKQALGRLIDAYGRVYERLQDKITLLMDAIEIEGPTRGELVRMTRYKALISQVEDELTSYQAILRNEIDGVSRDAIAFAGRDTARLLRTVGVGFNRLPNDTIQTLLGFLAPDSPLYERIGKLAELNAEKVANAILEGVSLGKNPRDIAGLIRDELGGGLTDALRMTRTVQNWSYREATRANYINNADVIEGWIWYADLPGEPCMACIAEHGSFHTLDETLDDHYNGRCTMIPVVTGMPEIVDQSGEAWFSELPEAKQRELMGSTKFDTWKEGKFEFSQLAGKHTDEVYGSMTSEVSLKDLLEGETAVAIQEPKSIGVSIDAEDRLIRRVAYSADDIGIPQNMVYVSEETRLTEDGKQIIAVYNKADKNIVVYRSGVPESTAELNGIMSHEYSHYLIDDKVGIGESWNIAREITGAKDVVETSSILQKLGGVTDYSNWHWQHLKSLDTAFHETIAEVAFLDSQGKLESVNKIWIDIYRTIKGR